MPQRRNTELPLCLQNSRFSIYIYTLPAAVLLLSSLFVVLFVLYLLIFCEVSFTNQVVDKVMRVFNIVFVIVQVAEHYHLPFATDGFQVFFLSFSLFTCTFLFTLDSILIILHALSINAPLTILIL
jgi:hypothetical protein